MHAIPDGHVNISAFVDLGGNRTREIVLLLASQGRGAPTKISHKSIQKEMPATQDDEEGPRKVLVRVFFFFE